MAALIDAGETDRGGRHPLRRLGTPCPAAPAARQARARTARRLSQRRHQPRCRDRLHPRRRSRRQLAVWHQLKDHSYIPPYTVRRLLTQAAVPLDSDLGLFVGSAAYEAAGGTVTRDLFSGDDEGFMDDAALVRRLAIEKLEAEGRRIALLLGLDQGDARSRVRLHRAIPPRPSATGRASGRKSPRRSSASSSASRNSRKSPRTSGPTSLTTEAAQLEERRDELDESVEGLAVYARKTAPSPAASSRSAMTANFVSMKGSSNASATRDADVASDDGSETAVDRHAADRDDDRQPSEGLRLRP